MIDVASFTESIRPMLVHTAPDLPEADWWLPLVPLAALGAAAAIDVFIAIVPDQLIVIGMFAGHRRPSSSFIFSARQLGWGIGDSLS